ncbi:hypothetical protein BKA70DRAFT_1241740 [Coprinopsis sp. MPI-PUGE-AT-0042]|nr:hypothetical protein BKA70DRAFT_1241740 [Coprinopsis sp. MPI-PUGE-AT-0042]
MALTLLILFVFLARMVFFRLHESSRNFASPGRPHDTIKPLQLISRFKGSEMELNRDPHIPEARAALSASLSNSPTLKLSSPPTQGTTSRTALFNAAGDLQKAEAAESWSG